MNYQSYEHFEEQKVKCRECPVGSVYDMVVLSDGCKSTPRVMVIGEAAGRNEVEEGKPFVGRAGKLLRATLNEFGLSNINTLISNVIPCRPENNKFPSDNQLVQNCYSKWLREEIILTKVKYLLLVGAKPLKFLVGGTGITKMRGKWYDLFFENHNRNPVKAFPTFHPSYVLRKKYMSEGKIIEENFRNDIKEVSIKAGIDK